MFSIENAVKSYGGRRALDGITIGAGAGILGVLGPNGAGKTTLMRILATVAAVDAGPGCSARIRRRRGTVPGSAGAWGTCRRRAVSRGGSPLSSTSTTWRY